MNKMLMKSLILVGLCMFYSGSTAPQNNNGNEVCIPATSLASRLPEFTGLLVGPKGEKGDPGVSTPERTSDRETGFLNEEIVALNETLNSLLNQKYGPCPSIQYDFPDSAHSSYVRYLRRFPTLGKATFCSWIYTKNTNGYSVASYASSGNSNDFLVWHQSRTEMLFYVDGKENRLSVNLPRRTWTHICVWFDSTSRTCGAYSNGISTGNLAPCKTATVTGRGALMLAQEQDDIGTDLDPNQVLRGSMKNTMFWPRVLSASEIKDIARNCVCPKDYAISMTPDRVEMIGNVNYSFGDTCQTV